MKFVSSHPLNEAGMKLIRENNIDLFVGNSADPHDFLDELKTADAYIVRVATCPADIIEACPNLKVLGRTGVGYDSIDWKKAREAGIPIVLTLGANARSVAEHAFALMFACAKNLAPSEREFLNGNWEVRNTGRAFELEGRKIGIVGVGAIGTILAKMCQGIGMKTAGYDAFAPQNVVKAGCELYENLDDMLRECDVISLHSPLTDDTYHMIGARELSLMKKTAMLINTSRGPIVDSAALADALNNDVIFCAGIDVYDSEPADLSDPLFKAKHLTCTPHSAAQTNEAIARMHSDCVEGCIAILKGEQWPKVADRSVYTHPRFQK